jgi:hypothetical protein
MKRFHWFEILLIIAVLAIQLYAAFSQGYNFPRNWFIRDDAYYYFKVAENISLGHGSTFDGINPTNGYHPLWMLICIPIFALARFDLILPLRVVLIVMSLFSLATAILLYRLIGIALSPPVGMLAAVYWVFNFYIQDIFYNSGLESGIALFFIIVLIYMLYQLERNKSKLPMRWYQIAWFGVIATLTTFSRLDLAFFAIIVGLWIVFRDEPMRYLMPFDILAVITAVLVAFLIRLGLPKYYELSGAALTMIFIGLIVKIPTFFFMSLYPRPATWKPLEMLRNIFLAVIISSGVMAILITVGSRLNILPSIPRIILLTDAALTLIALILIRAMAFGLRGTYEGLKSDSPLEHLKQHWQQWLKEGSIYYGILGISLSLYMLWNKLAFGTFTPVSGQIKQWWSTFATNIYGSPALFFQTFFAVTPNNTFNAWGLALSPIDTWNQFITGFLPPVILQVDGQIRFFGFLALLGAMAYLLLFLVKKRKARAVLQTGLVPLFVGGWIQIFSYNSTGYVSPQEWYWLAELVFTMIFAALLLDTFLDLFFREWHAAHFGIWTLAGLICISWTAQYYQNTIEKMTYQPAPDNRPYISELPFLESNTQPGDLIGISGGGNVGYFIHNRTIINMDGLINSYPYYLAMQNGAGADYLYKEGMRYIFANPEVLKAPPYSGQYGGRLTVVADYGDKDLLKLSAPNP